MKTCDSAEVDSTGVSPTLFGYSIQGSFKYGFYEYFKKTYSDIAGPENAVRYKDAIYLAGSASAEFFGSFISRSEANTQQPTPPTCRSRPSKSACRRLSRLSLAVPLTV